MYLDHIVHHVMKKPIQVAEEWKEKGLHAVVGGQHIHWGTHNALLYTKTSYIEWLALEHEKVANNADHPLVNLLLHDLKHGSGFGTICIRTVSMDKLHQELEEEGIETSGILHAERKTASGLVRKWKMLFVKQTVDDTLPLPFFIEWEIGDAERYEQFQADGTIKESNLELSITVCEFRVHNPREVMDKWKQYFHFKEIDDETLLLPNTQLVFKRLENGTKERLSKIYIDGFGGKRDIIYENATYCFRN